MENNLTNIPKERPQEINEILNSLKRYDISIIKELENYVFKQIKENFQDLNSNLALLQLYSLSDEDIYEFEDDSEETKEINNNNNNTEEDDEDEDEDDYDYKIRTDISIKILIKGLINFNYNDFELYLNLLPSYVLNEIKDTKESKESKESKDTITSDPTKQKKLKSIDEFNYNTLKLIEVYKELINCKFEKFWLIFNDKESTFNKILNTYYYTAITESSSTSSTSTSIIENSAILKFAILKSISKLLKHSTISINLNQLLKIFNGFESKDKTIEFIKNELNWEINDKNIVLINDSTNEINENDNSNTNSNNTSENIKIEQLSRILKKIVEF